MAKKQTGKSIQKVTKSTKGATKQGMPMMPPMGNMGGQSGLPKGKSQPSTPTPPKGKKPMLKIDIMMAKAAPGIGSNGKPVKGGKKNGKGK
ncbi:MAG: hypothetical protein Q8911_00475 [Bacillota bacterium]|nr:hypothetical protein [Bacillota bacterium]